MLKFELGFKGLPKKKIIIYLVLIVLSVIGTVFFIYQNKQLKSSKVPPGEIIETEMEIEKDIVEKTKTIDVKVVEQLDATIFQNEKFRRLKGVVYQIKEAQVGRDNPFIVPYPPNDEVD